MFVTAWDGIIYVSVAGRPSVLGCIESRSQWRYLKVSVVVWPYRINRSGHRSFLRVFVLQALVEKAGADIRVWITVLAMILSCAQKKDPIKSDRIYTGWFLIPGGGKT